MKTINREKIERMVGRGTGGGGGGGRGVDLAGYASQAWVEQQYISKEFFLRLFSIHGHNAEDTSVNPEDIIIEPNDTDEDTTVLDSIEAKAGLWTNSFVSALGLNPAGGGTGDILSEPLLSINSAGLGHPTRPNVGIVWDGTRWVYGETGGGSTGMNPLTVKVGTNTTVIEYKGETAKTLTFDAVANSGITVSGDTGGTITIGYTLPKATNDILGGVKVGNTLSISDGVLNLPAISNLVAGTYRSVVVDAYGRVTAGTNPTTLEGYGITDAKIANGVITLGTNTITPLTDAKIKSDYEWWGQKLDASGKVSGNIIIQLTTVDTNTYADANPKLIFKNANGSQNISLTFTDYDVVAQPASLTLNGNQGNELFIAPRMKADRLYLYKPNGSGDTNAVYLEYDSANGGVHLVGAGLYSDSYVSALGKGDDGGTSTFDESAMWTALAASGTSHKINNDHLSLGTLTINGETWNPATSGNKTITITSTDGYITPIASGNVNTAKGDSNVWFKKAGVSSDGTPNNGVVIEYGNSTSWVGQLYLSDNAEQGLYWNGWYDGVRGTWKKIAFADDYLPLAGGTMLNTNLVTNMNADLLDGYHATSFMRPIPAGSYNFNFTDDITTGGVYQVHSGQATKQTSWPFDYGLLANFVTENGHLQIAASDAKNDIKVRSYWWTGNSSFGNYPDWQTLIHSGNIGTYAVTALGTSGNDLTWTKNGTANKIIVPYATNADTVDGIHASGLFTALSNSGNNISVTIGGTTKSLTVGYASIAGKLNTGTSTYSAWGQTYWSNGVPKTISGLLSDVSGIKINSTGSGRGYIDFHYASASSLTSNIYEYQSGQLSINDLLYVTKGGNVGIGTSNPIEKLHVEGKILSNSIRIYGAQVTDDSKGLFIQASDKTNRAWITWHGNVANSDYLNIASGFGNIVLAPSKNVGIGTTNPTAKLEVNGSVKIGGATLTWDSDKQALKIDKGFYSDSFVSALGANASGGSGSGIDANWLKTNDVQIQRLGIGVAPSSSNQLNVQGASNFTGAVSINSALTVNSSVSAIGGFSTSQGSISAAHDITAGGRGLIQERLTVGQSLVNTSYQLYVNGTSLFNGNVGIGGYDNACKLYVSGKVKFSKMSISNTTNPDSTTYTSLGVSDSLNVSVTGSANINKAWVVSSDMRLKDVWKHFDIDITSVAKAPLFTYRLKNSGSQLMVGTSAQYWMDKIPETVTLGYDGYYGLDYNGVLTASVISTARKVVDHELRIKQLEQENAILREEIKSLKAA